MKKIVFTLFLVCVFVSSLSVNALAEGGIPIGGRTCPPNTTCVTDGGIPIGGRNSADTQAPTTQADEPTIFKTVIVYLAQLFG